MRYLISWNTCVSLERLEPSHYGCWIVYFENSHNLCHFIILGCESENLERESLLSVALYDIHTFSSVFHHLVVPFVTSLARGTCPPLQDF